MLKIAKKKLVSYPLRFFQREKKASEFISVGSKNLLIVNGNFRLSRCWTPLYKNRIVNVGYSEKSQKS